MHTHIFIVLYTLCVTLKHLLSLDITTSCSGGQTKHVTDRSSMQNKQTNVVPKINIENKCKTQNNVNLDTITQQKM